MSSIGLIHNQVTVRHRKSFPRYSDFLNFFSTLLLLIFFALGSSLEARAQMFSGDHKPEKTSGGIGGPSISAGVEFAEFIGLSASESGNGELEFQSDLVALLIDLGGIEVYSRFGQGINTPSGNELSVFLIGANLGNLFPLLMKERVRLFVPLTLTTDFLRVSKNQALSEFQQSSLQVASGAQLLLGGVTRRGPALLMKAEPFVGFSYSQGSLFGGGVRGFRGEVAASGFQITPRFSVRLGYRFQTREYNIDGSLYDYQLKGHSLLVGVQF